MGYLRRALQQEVCIRNLKPIFLMLGYVSSAGVSVTQHTRCATNSSHYRPCQMAVFGLNTPLNCTVTVCPVIRVILTIKFGMYAQGLY